MPLLPVFAAALTLAAQAQKPTLKSFPSAEEAVQAAIAAAGKNDVVELNAIFGRNSKAILTSGDAKQDEEERAQFARLAAGKHRIEKDPMDHHRATLDVGPEDWPFPVPLVEANGTWSFDPVRGDLEVRARRIGANELDIIEVCAGYVQAQKQYAATDRDKDGILEFADRLKGTPGKEDGLYGGKTQLIPQAFAEAEMRAAAGKATPYHGYYFRVLKAQGPNAPGGPREYFANQRIMGGFALVAWPASYGVTGIRTFVVSQDGDIYEKDLRGGPLPVKYDPDRTWQRVD